MEVMMLVFAVLVSFILFILGFFCGASSSDDDRNKKLEELEEEIKRLMDQDRQHVKALTEWARDTEKELYDEYLAWNDRRLQSFKELVEEQDIGSYKVHL